MNNKYYICYTVDAGMPMEVWKVLEAASIADAYLRLFKTTGGLFFGGEGVKDEENAQRLLHDKDSGTSINFLFLVPDEFQWITVSGIQKYYKDIDEDNFKKHFILSKEKIIHPRAQSKFPELWDIYCTAQVPLPSRQKIVRRFNMTFLPRTWFRK